MCEDILMVDFWGGSPIRDWLEDRTYFYLHEERKGEAATNRGIRRHHQDPDPRLTNFGCRLTSG